MATNYIYVVQPLDEKIKTGATRLAAKTRKNPGDINKLFWNEGELRTVPRKFEDRDKVTLIGHGTVNGKPGTYTLGGKYPETLAATVNKYFAKIPKIVLLMCADDLQEGPQRFVKKMREYGYKNPIVAYSRSMTVNETTKKREAFIPNPLTGMNIMGGALDALPELTDLGKKYKRVYCLPNDDGQAPEPSA